MCNVYHSLQDAFVLCGAFDATPKSMTYPDRIELAVQRVGALAVSFGVEPVFHSRGCSWDSWVKVVKLLPNGHLV